MKVQLKQTILRYAFQVHYHGLDGIKIKIRLSPQISCMHLNMMVEFKSIDNSVCVSRCFNYHYVKE